MDEQPIRVLLIEDNSGDARLIREAFREMAGVFTLTWVESLAAGLDALAPGDVDVVLLDLSLPDSFGIDTISRVETAAPQTPIVVLTGRDDENLAVTAVQSGAQDYLVKGEVEGRLLLRSIRYAIERHRMRLALQSLSLMDELTGLHNRRGFMTLARQQLKTADRFKTRLVLVFADLDGMKWINDNLGHKVGDQALIETAELLTETFRESDIIARLGGDEFVVLAVGGDEVGEEIIAKRFADNLAALNNQVNRSYLLSISLGIALYDPYDPPGSIEELLERGDALMYEQKREREWFAAAAAVANPLPAPH